MTKIDVQLANLSRFFSR